MKFQLEDDAEDMADYLMETIDELHVKAQDVILDTYNNLMIWVV